MCQPRSKDKNRWGILMLTRPIDKIDQNIKANNYDHIILIQLFQQNANTDGHHTFWVCRTQDKRLLFME